MGKKARRKLVVRKIVEEKQEEQKSKIFGKKSKEALKEEALEETEEKVVKPKTKKKKKTSKKNIEASKNKSSDSNSEKTSDNKEKNSEKKESKKDKAAEKKEKSKKKSYSFAPKQIFAGTLSLIMLGILSWVGFILFQKTFRPEPIAKFLPANQTILSLEFNIDFNHLQSIQAFELLQNYPQYSEENLISTINDQFEVNYKKEIQPWIGRQAGIALLEGKIAQLPQPIYFLEVLSETAANEYFAESYEAIDYPGYKIYKIDEIEKINFFQNNQLLAAPKYLTIVDNYVIATTEKEEINKIIETLGSRDSLYFDSKYRRIDDNLPFQRIGYFYMDYQKLKSNILPLLPALTNDSNSILLLEALFSVYSAEGAAIVSDEDKFFIQSFVTLDVNDLDQEKFIAFSEKYQARLTNLISKDTTVFWGSQNFKLRLDKLNEILPAQEVLENISRQFFGAEVNFNEEILPLLHNEFMVSVENIESEPVGIFILELSDKEKDAKTIHQLADKYSKMAAAFEPQVVAYILPDGTYSQEIVAVPEEVYKSERNYQNGKIFELEIGDSEPAFSYGFVDDYAIFSTKSSGIEKTIDLLNNPKNSIKNSPTFVQIIEPILLNSDEISYFNISEISQVFAKELPALEFLQPFQALTSGKNYFNDGIITTNFLNIR